MPRKPDQPSADLQEAPMQTNTPTPVQRNRRAGRLSPLDPAEAPVQQPPAVQPSSLQPPQAAPAQPVSPAPPLQPLYPPSGASTPPHYTAPAAPVQQPGTAMPAYPRRSAAPVQQPGQAYPDAYSRHVYPQTSVLPVSQPAARRTAASPAPTQTRSIPAGTRPQAAGQPVRMRHDDPDARRGAAAKASRPPRAPETPVRKPEKLAQDEPQRRTTPSWLRNLLSLMFVGVMALVAATAVMMATLKTRADEQQKAWENMLFNYHLTEQADGALRVTWQDLIEHYAALYNLDPAFVTAIIRNESSFRTDAVSSVGARGLMQMMPDTAEWISGKLDVPYDFDRLFEAETAIRYGCWYLGYLADLFGGDTVLVCAAYHAGQGEVLGWLGDSGISPDGVSVPIQNIPITNTRTYAERVTKAYGVYDALLYPAEPVQTPDVSGAYGAAASGMHAR